jgi:hypothetical protein
MAISTHHLPSLELFFTPVRLVSGVAQSMVSAAIGSWLIACFVSMTEEP